ncbi:hypothetical protein [Xanthovirga aplysinae]|uniref:hypothetical protein n=1 Tax=Xanthovirga aplysinae TaxID=2529853 RepID=UPI0012BBFA37|nr:hypothetical protein [Xanthovirga aplysinae]MTI29631.1 hypothetical protein [Xanthovirga aplysinae]
MNKILYAQSVYATYRMDFEKLIQESNGLSFLGEELSSQQIAEEKNEWEGIRKLPLHLRYREYLISTSGQSSFVPQKKVIMPGDAIVQVLNVAGEMEMGLGPANLVYPNGSFIKTGDFAEVNDDFVLAEANAYSLLIANQNVVLLHKEENGKASSVAGYFNYWALSARDGGQCLVAFNSKKDDNRGLFYATLRIWHPFDFFNYYRSIFKV